MEYKVEFQDDDGNLVEDPYCEVVGIGVQSNRAAEIIIWRKFGQIKLPHESEIKTVDPLTRASMAVVINTDFGNDVTARFEGVIRSLYTDLPRQTQTLKVTSSVEDDPDVK